MNVLELDVYRDVLYIVCVHYAGFVIPAMLVILFSAKKNNKARANLRWRRIGHRRLASVIYVGRASHCRLSWLTYDGPLKLS
jgi:hypothetical protein